MKKYLYSLPLVAIAVMATSCTSWENTYNENAAKEESEANFVKTFGEIASDQTWNDVTTCNANVTVSLGTDSKYTVGVYDRNPLDGGNYSTLAYGTVAEGGTFTSKMECSKTQTDFYVIAYTSDSIPTIQKGTMNNGVLNVSFGGNSNSAKATRSSTTTRISSPASSITWASAPNNSDFANKVPKDAYDISLYGQWKDGIGNITSGNFEITNNASGKELNTWTSTNIYVTGSDVRMNYKYISANTSLYILKGAKLTFTNATSFSANPTKIYISEGGTLAFSEGVEIAQYCSVYNQGALNSTNISVSNNGLLYNQGTINATSKVSVENNTSQLINEGTINTVDFNTAGSGAAYNLDGKVYATGTTLINSNSNFWVNNGYWETYNYTYNAGSQNVINNCKLIVNNLMNIVLGDGNGYLLVDGGGEVVTKDLYMNTAQVNLYGSAMFKVTGTATYGNNKAGRGFQGTGSKTSLVLITGKAIATSPNDEYCITYGGNLVVACANHFARYCDTGKGDVYNIMYEGNALLTTNTTSPGVTISANGDCCDGFKSKKVDPSDDTPAYTIAYEDLGTTDDFDFNDIVLYIYPDATTNKLRVDLVAAGGTLPVTVKYDGTELFSKSGGMKNTTTRGKVLDSKTVDLPSGFSMTNSNYTSLFQIEVKGTNSSYVVHPNIAAGAAPQALVIAGAWDWPLERVQINTAYPNFNSWVSDPNADWISYKVASKCIK